MKIITVVAILAFPLCALAHVTFDHAEPKVGEKVKVSPSQVKIWFSDDVCPALCSIEILDSSGKQVDKKDAHVDEKDKSEVIVSVPDLPPGTYKVEWRSACVDQHKVKGSYKFEVAAP